MKAQLRHESFVLDQSHRICVEDAIRRECDYRHWDLHALAVCSNHVHVVVSADVAPEKVMGTLKSWATRRLKESGLLTDGFTVWSRHGSTRYLNDEASFRAACRYVDEGQGDRFDS
jgi:REP element-mobilizing transposase RayT